MADRYERNRLAAFKTGMDTIQFPYDKPLSKELIRKIAIQQMKIGDLCPS